MLLDITASKFYDWRERYGKANEGTSPFSRGILRDARNNIARYLIVGTAIERAEAVMEAAEEDPEVYGHLTDQMDRSGKVAGALIADSQYSNRPRSWRPSRHLYRLALSK